MLLTDREILQRLHTQYRSFLRLKPPKKNLHDKNKLINVKQIAENLTSLFKSSQS